MTSTSTTPATRVLLVAILASFVAFLDSTVVTVALPAIQRELGGGLSTQQWVVDAYLVTLGAFILVAGAISDAFGRVLVLRVGLIGFGVTSLAISLAGDPVLLIVARALQGVAGALLVPSSLALIMTAFRGADQARAIGRWTAATTSAMVIGPILGGLFVDYASWRWAFVINLIPIAVTLWMLHPLGALERRVPGKRVDILGALLCVIGLGGSVFALIEQQNLGWDNPAVWGSFVLGILSFAGFLIRQRFAAHPIMPLSLFKARNFWAGNLTTTFVYAALALNGFVIGVYLQQGVGWSATLAGIATLPVTLLMILLSARVGTLAGRFGPRIFMTVGPGIMAVGALVFLTVAEDFSYWAQMLPGVIVFGFGLTLTVSPLTSAILGAIDSERSGIASAVNNAVARIAGLIVIALLSFIVAGNLDLAGFHRAAIVTAALLAAGAVISYLGIRTPKDSEPSA